MYVQLLCVITQISKSHVLCSRAFGGMCTFLYLLLIWSFVKDKLPSSLWKFYGPCFLFVVCHSSLSLSLSLLLFVVYLFSTVVIFCSFFCFVKHCTKRKHEKKIFKCQSSEIFGSMKVGCIIHTSSCVA